jgi:hypothetical protein
MFCCCSDCTIAWKYWSQLQVCYCWSICSFYLSIFYSIYLIYLDLNFDELTALTLKNEKVSLIDFLSQVYSWLQIKHYHFILKNKAFLSIMVLLRILHFFWKTSSFH